MKPARHARRGRGWWLAWLGPVAFACNLSGAGVRVSEPPRWLTLTPWNPFAVPVGLPNFNPLSTLDSINLEIEAERETRRSANSSVSTTVDRLFVAPTVGLAESGSIYHPNLFHFDFRSDLGYGRQEFRNSSGSPSSWKEDSFLNRYDVNAVLLRSKPYATSFFADSAHTIRDLDLFQRVTVDSQTYGGQTGYSQGPVPVSLSYKDLVEDQHSVDQDSHLEQRTLEFKARHERSTRSTSDLFYSYGDYNRETLQGFQDESTYHYASLYDAERWGARDRYLLNSSLTYNQVDSGVLPSKSFTATEYFSADHTPTLQSSYDYTFNAFSATPADTYSHYGRAGLRHQLYESLVSGVDLHGSSAQTDATEGSQNQWRVGAGWDEAYTKRLSTWGRFSMDNRLRVDREQRDVSGSQLLIANEPHILVNGETLLNQPNVLNIVQVTDTNRVTSYQQGIDYDTVQLGSLLQIRRIPTSVLLTNDNAAILVTYVVNLVPGQGEGSFWTLADQFQVRLDLFNNFLGFYSRLNWIQNYGGEQFVLENTFGTQSGADVSGKWYRAGGEYETRDSNLIDYRSVNLYQSFFFAPTDTSTLGVDFRQRWARYPSENRDVSDYTFLLRHQIRFARYFTHSLEGGIRVQEGQDIDQRQYVARTELTFIAGKIRMNLGYQFNNDDVRGDLTEKHFAYLRLRRAF